MKQLTPQEEFWRNDYGADYLKSNANFDTALGVEGWRRMLESASDVKTVLECGSNRGRNIGFLKALLPSVDCGIIEIFPEAFEIVTSEYQLGYSYKGPILDAPIPPEKFDLVFMCGVLIHVSPAELAETMKKMASLSRKYVLIAEYFNRTPTTISYQGRNDTLYKLDFGSFYLDHVGGKVLDYGFLWGREFDQAGFDDITWWLFQIP